MNEQILKVDRFPWVAETLQRTCELMFKTSEDSRPLCFSIDVHRQKHENHTEFLAGGYTA